MKKKINISFLFVLSLVFLSCSNALKGGEGKVSLTLPYGEVTNARYEGKLYRSDDNSAELKSYFYYFRLVNSEDDSVFLEASGTSGDNVVFENVEPGLWGVFAIACEKDFAEDIKSYGENIVKVVFTSPDLGFDYYVGLEEVEVYSGETSNVKLPLYKIAHKYQKLDDIKVDFLDSENYYEVTSDNFDSYIKECARVYAVYNIYEDNEVVDSEEIEITDYSYTEVKEDEIGFRPVIFSYTDSSGETYTSEPQYIQLYYDFAKLADTLEYSLDASYTASTGDELEINASAADFKKTLYYYPELVEEASQVDGLSLTFELCPLGSTWYKDKEEIDNEGISFLKVDTSAESASVYYVSTEYTIMSYDDIYGADANAFVLPAVCDSPSFTVTVEADDVSAAIDIEFPSVEDDPLYALFTIKSEDEVLIDGVQDITYSVKKSSSIIIQAEEIEATNLVTWFVNNEMVEEKTSSLDITEYQGYVNICCLVYTEAGELFRKGEIVILITN